MITIMEFGLKILPAVFLLVIISYLYLYQTRKNQPLLTRTSWQIILGGFGLLLVGTLIDITGEPFSLSKSTLTGPIDIQALKDIAFSSGYLLLLIGFVRWIPHIRRLADKNEAQLPVEQAPRQACEEPRLQEVQCIAESIRSNAAWGKEITEQATLQEKDALLSAIMEGATDAIFLVDAQGYYRMANTTTAQLLGKPVETLVGKYLREVFPAEKAGLFLEQNHQIIREGQAQHFEYTITVEGMARSYSVMKALYRDRQGQITGVIGIARDITERKSYEAQLEYQVNYDSLTQLPNRILLQNRLRRAIARARRNNQQIAVLFLDLDGFKMINDSLGHAAGDELLKAVASRLNECIREEDTVARLSGDEFVMVLESLAQEECATRVARKVLKTMEAPFILEKQTCFVTTSIGISIYPRDGQDKETLLKKADTALYQTKGRGGKGIQRYTPQMDLSAPNQSTLEKPSSHGTLLIVDDDEGMTACLRRLLRGEDYLILTAHSGWEGLALLACHRIEVVVSDQLMPEMSGTTFLKQVRELYPDTTRILLSGSDDREFLIEAINEGAIYKFMDKSLDSTHWRTVIHEAFLFHKQQKTPAKSRHQLENPSDQGGIRMTKPSHAHCGYELPDK